MLPKKGFDRPEHTRSYSTTDYRTYDASRASQSSAIHDGASTNHMADRRASVWGRSLQDLLNASGSSQSNDMSGYGRIYPSEMHILEKGAAARTTGRGEVTRRKAEKKLETRREQKQKCLDQLNTNANNNLSDTTETSKWLVDSLNSHYRPDDLVLGSTNHPDGHTSIRLPQESMGTSEVVIATADWKVIHENYLQGFHAPNRSNETAKGTFSRKDMDRLLFGDS